MYLQISGLLKYYGYVLGTSTCYVRYLESNRFNSVFLMGKANDIRKAAKKRRQALSKLLGPPALSWQPCAHRYGLLNQGHKAEITKEQSKRLSNENTTNT